MSASNGTGRKAAVCLGSTGSVGKHLTEELLKSGTFSTVLAFVRKPTPLASAQKEKYVEHVVADMTKLEDEVRAVVAEKLAETECVGFSTLGIGQGTGFMSIEEHRAVDVGLNTAFAKGLKASGKVNHLVFMTAVGANPNAWASGWGGAGFPRYNRVKGESEEGVKSAGIDHVSIFRPAGILGNPNTGKVTETVLPFLHFLMPKDMQSIHATDLGRALAIRGAQDVSQEQEKVRIFHHPQFMEFLASVNGPV